MPIIPERGLAMPSPFSSNFNRSSKFIFRSFF
nr:MAG TPA: hypothetical protein [Microviridae sp.]